MRVLSRADLSVNVVPYSLKFLSHCIQCVALCHGTVQYGAERRRFHAGCAAIQVVLYNSMLLYRTTWAIALHCGLCAAHGVAVGAMYLSMFHC